MKRSAHFPVVFILAGAAITAVVFLNAADKSVTLPKGTKVEKLGSSQFRFTLPDGRKAEVKGLNAMTGIIGDCGIYDKGKLVAKGGGGSLVSPLDRVTLCEEVSRTHRLLVVDVDYEGFGLSGELAAVVLEADIQFKYGRVCTQTTIPYARELEKETLPNLNRIVDACRKLCV